MALPPVLPIRVWKSAGSPIASCLTSAKLILATIRILHVLPLLLNALSGLWETLAEEFQQPGTGCFSQLMQGPVMIRAIEHPELLRLARRLV